MSNITTLIYQFLNQTLGKLDWRPGSVIRELVAAPVVALSETAVASVNDVYNQLNIEMLLQDPENNAEAIDKLYDTLGLTETTGTRSTGSVQIFVEGSKSFQIPSGTTFFYDDIGLTTTDSYTATTTPHADNAAEIALVPVGVSAYMCIVPVSSITDGVNLSEGLDLSWPSLGADIYSAKVYETITGGQGAYTATQKINRIRQQLFPIGLSARESILRCINNASPDLAVDCMITSNAPTGTAGVFVKPTAAPKTWEISAEVAADANSADSYMVTIPATGVWKVKTVNGQGNFNVTIGDRLMTIRYASSEEQPSTVPVVVFGYPSLVEAQEILDDYTENTGLRINIYAPRPLLLSMRLPVTGTGAASLYDSIVGAVNNSLLNATTLGDTMVDPLLAAAGINRRSSGTYILEDMCSLEAKSALASIDPSVFLTGRSPYAVYTMFDKVSLIDG